jgi:hypothetical protein
MQFCAPVVAVGGRQGTHVANVHHVVCDKVARTTSNFGRDPRQRWLTEDVQRHMRIIAFNVHSYCSSLILPMQHAQVLYLGRYILYIRQDLQRFIIPIQRLYFVLRFQMLHYAICSGTCISWRSRARRLSFPVKQTWECNAPRLAQFQQLHALCGDNFWMFKDRTPSAHVQNYLLQRV